MNAYYAKETPRTSWNFEGCMCAFCRSANLAGLFSGTAGTRDSFVSKVERDVSYETSDSLLDLGVSVELKRYWASLIRCLRRSVFRVCQIPLSAFRRLIFEVNDFAITSSPTLSAVVKSNLLVAPSSDWTGRCLS